MVRTTHDVNISNSERAQVANDAGADVFIRIHANGSENPEVHGAMTICQTATNPYNAAYYEDIEDPYKGKHEGVAIQHITFEDFSGKKMIGIVNDNVITKEKDLSDLDLTKNLDKLIKEKGIVKDFNLSNNINKYVLYP